MSKATFAAGCFWGVQAYFDEVPGIEQSTVGYIGGPEEHPTYQDVAYQKTGHAEAVELVFDPNRISYADLVRHFFLIHDPTQLNRQGPDIGANYRSAIFYHDDSQKVAATHQKMLAQAGYDQEVVTEITPATHFWSAEEYHQKYTQKTGMGACHVAYRPLQDPAA